MLGHPLGIRRSTQARDIGSQEAQAVFVKAAALASCAQAASDATINPTHTIIAAFFGGPMPRWADEGASLLSEDERERWQSHCADRLHRGVGGGLTLAAYQERIDVLAETADERGQAILEALVDYAEQIAPSA